MDIESSAHARSALSLDLPNTGTSALLTYYALDNGAKKKKYVVLMVRASRLYEITYPVKVERKRGLA